MALEMSEQVWILGAFDDCPREIEDECRCQWMQTSVVAVEQFQGLRVGGGRILQSFCARVLIGRVSSWETWQSRGSECLTRQKRKRRRGYWTP